MRNDSSRRERHNEGKQRIFANIAEVLSRVGKIAGPLILLFGAEIVRKWLDKRRNK